ncbi:LysR family transcriptional regulator [Rickettsiales bacterium LUAb2]
MFEDWNKLKFFIITAKHLNISKAANELNISQPALSKHINNFEKSIKQVLFTRKNNGLELTINGANLYKKISPIFEAMLDISKNNKPTNTPINNNLSGTLTVIANSDFYTHFLSQKIAKFKQIYPLININGICSNLIDNYDLLSSPSILFTPQLINLANTMAIQYQNFVMNLYISATYLTTLINKDPINYINHLTFLTLSPNHSGYSNSLIPNNLTTTNKIITFDSLSSIYYAVVNNFGAAILPKFITNNFTNNLIEMQLNYQAKSLIYQAFYGNIFSNNQLISLFLNHD